MIDKRPYVRFHAAQSLVVLGAMYLLWYSVDRLFGSRLQAQAWSDQPIGWALLAVPEVLTVLLWLACMWKAFRGKRFEVPVAAAIAQVFAGK